MTVEQTNVVDFVTEDRLSGDVYLTISDHLLWGERVGEHLLLLQDKINAYLRFIESGELLQEFPKAQGKNVVINLVLKHQPADYAKEFFEKAARLIENAGFTFKWSVMASH